MKKKMKKRLAWLLAFSILGASTDAWPVGSKAKADDGEGKVPVVKMIKDGEDITNLTIEPSGVASSDIAFLIGLDDSGSVWTHQGMLTFGAIQEQVVVKWQAVKKTSDTIQVDWKNVGATVQAGEKLSIPIDASGYQTSGSAYQHVYATLVSDDGGDVVAHGAISSTDNSSVVTSATYTVTIPADGAISNGNYTLYIYVYTEDSNNYTASGFQSKQIEVASAAQTPSSSPGETDTMPSSSPAETDAMSSSSPAETDVTPSSSPAETDATSSSSPAETDTMPSSGPVGTGGTPMPSSSPEASAAPGGPEEPAPSPVPTVIPTRVPAPNPPTVVIPSATFPAAVQTQPPVASESPQASRMPEASEAPAASVAPIASEAPAASGMPAASEVPVASEIPMASEDPAASGIPTQAPSGDNQVSGTTVKQGNITYKVTKSGSAAINKVGTAQTKKKVTIPDTVSVGGKDYKVDTVSAGAFSGNKNLEKVTLGKNIKKIQKKAFQGCKNLKEVTFSNKVVTVGVKSFSGCTSLKKVTLPDSVKTIGNKAFKGCKSLKNVKIGKKNQKVKGGAVSAAPYIRTAKNGVVVVEAVPVYSVGSSPALTIGNYAFAACSSMKKVIINSAVRVIGSSAFRGCKKLSDITVNSRILETVRKMALKGINNCTITVPSSKFKPYCTLFRNKGQGKKVLIAKA